MKKEVGIVLDKVSDDFVSGFYEILSISSEVDDNGVVQIKPEFLKQKFFLNLETNILETLAGTLDGAKSVARKLEEIGYTDIKLLFSNELYDEF